MLILLAKSERRELMLKIAEASISNGGKPYFAAPDNDVLAAEKAEQCAGIFLK